MDETASLVHSRPWWHCSYVPSPCCDHTFQQSISIYWKLVPIRPFNEWAALFCCRLQVYHCLDNRRTLQDSDMVTQLQWGCLTDDHILLQTHCSRIGVNQENTEHCKGKASWTCGIFRWQKIIFWRSSSSRAPCTSSLLLPACTLTWISCYNYGTKFLGCFTPHT